MYIEPIPISKAKSEGVAIERRFVMEFDGKLI
jgi:hypothetical protein